MTVLLREIVFPIIFWLKKFNMKNNLIPRLEFFVKDIDNILDFTTKYNFFQKRIMI